MKSADENEIENGTDSATGSAMESAGSGETEFWLRNNLGEAGHGQDPIRIRHICGPASLNFDSNAVNLKFLYVTLSSTLGAQNRTSVVELLCTLLAQRNDDNWLTEEIETPTATANEPAWRDFVAREVKVFWQKRNNYSTQFADTANMYQMFVEFLERLGAGDKLAENR